MMYRCMWGAWVCPQCVWLCVCSVRYVCEGGKRDPNYLFGCPDYPLQSCEAVQFPNQAVMQLLGMLSIVPLCNVVKMWDGKWAFSHCWYTKELGAQRFS